MERAVLPLLALLAAVASLASLTVPARAAELSCESKVLLSFASVVCLADVLSIQQRLSLRKRQGQWPREACAQSLGNAASGLGGP